MKIQKYLSLLSMCFVMVACVTVNVYFPAAAAEKAVDEFVKEVYGETEEDQAPAEDDTQPTSWLNEEADHSSIVLSFVDFIIPPAQAAQPNIDIATPATNKLKASMKSRHKKLVAFYASGAVGMTANALLVVRDAKAIGLKERNKVKQIVAEENRDRNQLYKEIALANKHPEWESEIRKLFAGRWIANAPAGWWYDRNGWVQK